LRAGVAFSGVFLSINAGVLLLFPLLIQ